MTKKKQYFLTAAILLSVSFGSATQVSNTNDFLDIWIALFSLVTAFASCGFTFAAITEEN